MLIYVIKNKINGKLYIGQTCRTVDARIKDHLAKVRSGSMFPIHVAIRNFGWENFSVDVVARTDNLDILNFLEEFYIDHYHSDVDGYNLAPGGKRNCMESDVVKDKHDRIMRTPEVREKISKSMKAHIAEHGVSDEHRKHVSEGLRRFYDSGKKPNYRHPQHLSPEHYKALNDAKNKSVYCVDVYGNKIAEFDRVKDAAEWWMSQGYEAKLLRTVCCAIKRSYDNDRYMHGIKWIYCV